MTVYLLSECIHPDSSQTRPVRVYTDKAEAEAAHAALYYGGSIRELELV